MWWFTWTASKLSVFVKENLKPGQESQKSNMHQWCEIKKTNHNMFEHHPEHYFTRWNSWKWKESMVADSVPYEQQQKHLCPCEPWRSQTVASVSPTSPSPISGCRHSLWPVPPRWECDPCRSRTDSKPLDLLSPSNESWILLDSPTIS